MPSLWKSGSKFEFLCAVDSNFKSCFDLSYCSDILHAPNLNEMIYFFLGLNATQLKNISVAIVRARIESEKLACLNQMEISIKWFKYLCGNTRKI